MEFQADLTIHEKQRVAENLTLKMAQSKWSTEVGRGAE